MSRRHADAPTSTDWKMASSGTECGAGTLSTTFGVAVFLTMLLFGSHVLLNLWVMSSVDGVAHDAVTDVATSGAPFGSHRQAEEQAVDRAQQALGAYGSEVDMAFRSTPTEVVLHVSAPGLSILPPALASAVGMDGFERDLTVIREPTP